LGSVLLCALSEALDPFNPIASGVMLLPSWVFAFLGNKGAVSFGVGRGVMDSDGSLPGFELGFFFTTLFLLADLSIEESGEMKSLLTVSVLVNVPRCKLDCGSSMFLVASLSNRSYAQQRLDMHPFSETLHVFGLKDFSKAHSHFWMSKYLTYFR